MFDTKTAIQNLKNKLDPMPKKQRDAYLQRMGFQIASVHPRHTALHPKRHVGEALSFSIYTGK